MMTVEMINCLIDPPLSLKWRNHRPDKTGCRPNLTSSRPPMWFQRSLVYLQDLFSICGKQRK